MSKERAPYELSTQTKKEAREVSSNKCDLCGKEDQRGSRLQAHHIVAIWFARECGIAAPIIKQLCNVMCLCQECHTGIHLQENRAQYEQLAWYILGVDTHPDYNRDNWRKDPDHPINRLSKKKLRKQRKKKGRSNARRK